MKPAPQIESIQLDFDPLPPEREFQCFPEKKMFGLKEQKNETTEQLSTWGFGACSLCVWSCPMLIPVVFTSLDALSMYLFRSTGRGTLALLPS